MAFKVVGVQVHSSNVTMQVLVRELKYIAAMASGMWVLIWFVIHVLNLLPIRFTQRKFCCIRKVYDGAFAKIELEVEPHLI